VIYVPLEESPEHQAPPEDVEPKDVMQETEEIPDTPQEEEEPYKEEDPDELLQEEDLEEYEAPKEEFNKKISANLIILESKGIDVIFGMDWLRKHKGLIHYTKKAVKLTVSIGKELEYVTESLITNKSAFNRIVLNSLDVISTQNISIVSKLLLFF
jgi:hypothetical protein